LETSLQGYSSPVSKEHLDPAGQMFLPTKPPARTHVLALPSFAASPKVALQGTQVVHLVPSSETFITKPGSHAQSQMDNCLLLFESERKETLEKAGHGTHVLS
jgi:hypothetical protein